MKTRLFAGAIVTAVALCGSTFAKPKEKRSNISMDRAQELALKRVKGEIQQADLIKVKGKDRYSIFVKESSGATAHELLSARSGKVLWVRDETPDKAKVR